VKSGMKISQISISRSVIHAITKPAEPERSSKSNSIGGEKYLPWSEPKASRTHPSLQELRANRAALGHKILCPSTARPLAPVTPTMEKIRPVPVRDSLSTNSSSQAYVRKDFQTCRYKKRYTRSTREKKIRVHRCSACTIYNLRKIFLFTVGKPQTG